MCGRYYVDDEMAREIEKLVRQHWGFPGFDGKKLIFSDPDDCGKRFHGIGT